MYKAIIFDMDGTLIYTPRWYKEIIIKKTLKDLKKKRNIIEDDILNFWYSEKRDEYIQNEFCVDLKKFWERFKLNDAPYKRRKVTRAYEDNDFLKFLKKKYKLNFGILTNAHPSITEMQLEFLNKALFEIVINSHIKNGVKPKPNPEGLEYILNKLKVDKKESMLVGDGEEDILCARNSGILDILLCRGEHIVNLEPSFKINKLNSLSNILENVN